MATEAECLICARQKTRKLPVFECRHTLCSKCLKAVVSIDGDLGDRKKTLKCPLCKHKIAMKDFESAGYQTITKRAEFLRGEGKSLRCDEHVGRERNIYFEECETLQCPRCVLLEPATHVTSEKPGALHQSMRDILELVSAVKENIEIRKAELEAMSRSCKSLRSNFENTKRKISSKADEEVVRIRQREQQLMTEAEKVFADRVSVYAADRGHKFTVIGQSKRQLDKVTASKCSAILHKREAILPYIKNLKERSRPQKWPDMLSFIDFEEVTGSLGRLVLEDRRKTVGKAPSSNPPTVGWELKASIETYKHMGERGFNCAFDVAAFSDDEFVIADIGNNHLVACLLLPLQSASPTPQTLATSERLSVGGFGDPWRVAVNLNSELLVVDGNSVKVHTREYCPLRKLTTGEDRPLCMAVTDFNLIALGYRNEIRLFTPTGSKIRTFPAPMIGEYLTTYKKVLIYTNHQESKLESLNLKGDRVFSVDLGVNGLPHGVCCDKDGIIFVALAIGFKSGKIVQYSRDGKFIGCIIEGCGEPWSITLTPNGELVIAAGKSVKVYHRA